MATETIRNEAGPLAVTRPIVARDSRRCAITVRNAAMRCHAERSSRPCHATRRPPARAAATSPAQRRAATVERCAPAVRSRAREALPLAARRDDLLAAIRDHQVVIVAGETGSGKSTQLPKLCLELGRGVDGLIGHTQPRRVAARTIAERVAEELGTELGTTVGYTVRFTDTVGEQTLRQGDDRRHPAGRDPARPHAAPLRHAHHRRGPRAQPQHRLPARLPRAAAAAAARPEAHRHVGHHRHATLQRALRRPDGSPAPIIEVSGRTYPGGGALPTVRRA